MPLTLPATPAAPRCPHGSSVFPRVPHVCPLPQTFLSIPIGLTRALASQTMHLLDDDESEDGDEEEDERAGAGAGGTGGQAAEGEGDEGHDSFHDTHVSVASGCYVAG